MLFVVGCAATVSTTPARRDADCQSWRTRADAEDARARRLDGGKGTYTAESNAAMYRDGIQRYCVAGGDAPAAAGRDPAGGR